MKTPQTNTSAFDIFKNYLPSIVLIGGGFVALVLAWKDIGDNKKKYRIIKRSGCKAVPNPKGNE